MSEKPSYLDSLEQDIRFYSIAIKEASETIIQDQISNYPVFIAHKGFFPVGELILDKKEYNAEWSINATTAEDLIKEGIIPFEKARFFITQYKLPNEFICLFVVPDDHQASFIFIPYN